MHILVSRALQYKRILATWFEIIVLQCSIKGELSRPHLAKITFIALFVRGDYERLQVTSTPSTTQKEDVLTVDVLASASAAMDSRAQIYVTISSPSARDQQALQ